MSCNIGECIKYACSAPEKAVEGAVYAPYIKIRFAGGQIISVGNQSSPKINLAAIQSMTYGFTSGGQGFGIDVEIIDNGGVMYRKVVRAMNKTLGKTREDVTTLHVDFGWIVTYCNGTSELQSCKSLQGFEPKGLVLNVDASFENGGVKMKIAIRAPQSRMYETAHAGSSAGEDQKISLKSALRKLFTELEPKYSGVDFRDKNGGSDFEFKNSDGAGGEGPQATWPYDQESTYTTATKWLSSILTKNSLGVQLVYDNKRNFMIIQEDVSADKTLCNNHLATYVINGGNCSPVISFTPQCQFYVGTGSGAGGASSGASSGDNQQTSEPVMDVQKAGNQIQVSTQQHEWQFRSPDDMANKAIAGFNKQMDAARAVGQGLQPQPFGAELKIQGNPRFSDPLMLIKKMISIVFINPFYIGEGCTWLQTSNCNSMLSNKEYMIQGVCHQIQNGSFTTTFNLYLTVPNVSDDFDAALGGAGGTETFVDGEDGKGQSLPLDGNQNG